MAVLFFIQLFYIAVIDFFQHRIPNISLILLILFRFFYAPLKREDLLSSSSLFLLFLFFYFLSHGGIGMGDVKLISVLGLFLGFSKTMFLVLLATLFLFLIGIFLKLLGQKMIELPFAPAFISIYFVIYWMYVFKEGR